MLTNSSNTTVPEEELWAIFHCLARACLVMHQGSEDADAPAPRWPRQEMVHFDLKLENGEASDDLKEVCR